MHTWFHSAPLTEKCWSVTIGLALVIFLMIELANWFGRRLPRSA